MPLPNNFSGAPHEEPHRYFRNACIAFKKTVHETKDLNLLQDEMEKFINAAKQMNWHPKTTGTYHKDEGAKAADKVWKEFDRYFRDLTKDAKAASPKDLLEALTEVERLIHNLKIT
ncbi:MAG: hypothetical protein JSR58_07165 [Verrucomicrobia bacterium]|nr:hypothetical protein [Verrucomicrobiota bacterium]